MHQYHAVLSLLSKPGHPNIGVLSPELLAVPAPGPSFLVHALRAWAFPGGGPEVLKARPVRDPRAW